MEMIGFTRLSFRSKLILPNLVAMVLLCLAILAATYHSIRNDMTERSNADVLRGLRVATSTIEEMQQQLLIAARLSAMRPELVDAEERGDRPTLRSLARDFHERAEYHAHDHDYGPARNCSRTRPFRQIG
jgi:Tfp pilus assembly protein PilO